MEDLRYELKKGQDSDRQRRRKWRHGMRNEVKVETFRHM